MSHYRFGKDIQDKRTPNSLKVAIVGAGMSGLYSAWRLIEEKNENQIAIFERSDRTGGRLDSDLINFKGPKVNGGKQEVITVKEEQGGMRFLFDGMDDLMALFLKLDLQDEIVPFPMNSGGNNRLYFRGKSFSVEDAKKDNFAIWSSLYNLQPAEQGIKPNEIINLVFNRILQANPHFDQRPDKADRGPEFWQAFRLECCWKDQPLYQWSLWDLMTDMGYSQECINMLYRVLGFNGTFLSKMNAGVAYQLLEDFPADAEFRTFKKGFSSLPNALVDRIGEDKIYLQTSIESIDFDDVSQRYQLHYQHITEQGKVIKDTVEAEQVILALPRLALEKLFVKSNAFNTLASEPSSTIWNSLQGASNQPLLKINLYYENAWWGNGISGRPSVAFGPNFADLPTGSVYPFYALDNRLAAALMYQEQEASPDAEIQSELDDINREKYKKPAALTIYCDYLNINFWSSLQKTGDAYHSPKQDTLIESVPADIEPASTEVVKQATAFFKDIFDTHYVPEPVLTSARIWEGSTAYQKEGAQQFGYGVHQWAVGANDKEVIEELIEPLPGLYTCGEAFSDYQGWVEGALRSTDLVMEKGFGLKALSQVYEEETHISPSLAIKAVYKENANRLIQEYIDKDFHSNDPHTLPRQDEDSCIGIKLSYFDQKDH